MREGESIMKLSGFAIVLSFLLINGSNAQSQKDNLKDKIYLKAGYSYSYRSYAGSIKKDWSKHSGYSIGSEGWVDVFSGGIGYYFSKRLSFEVNYEYINGNSIGYSDYQFRANSGYPDFKTYHSVIGSDFDSHDLAVRFNYFVNDDRKVNPIYFIGSLSFAVQPVKNLYIEEYETYNLETNQSYYRYTVGPAAGVGVFWDTGLLSFETELTIGARVSLYRGELSEHHFTLSISPLFRL